MTGVDAQARALVATRMIDLVTATLAAQLDWVVLSCRDASLRARLPHVAAAAAAYPALLSEDERALLPARMDALCWGWPGTPGLGVDSMVAYLLACALLADPAIVESTREGPIHGWMAARWPTDVRGTGRLDLGASA